MYYKMQGKYEKIDQNTGSYNVNGISYLINHIDSVQLDDHIYVKAIYKEDSVTLYGFNICQEHTLFNNLIAMRGLGPKTAMNILSSATMTQLEQAIRDRNPDVFAKAKGVSANKAKQILFDLTGVVVNSKNEKLKKTLKGLGYSNIQLNMLDEAKLISDSFDDRVIEAIRVMSNA